MCVGMMTFQSVDLLEFVGFGIGGTGHPASFVVHAEIILVGNRSERLIFPLDAHTLLGFYRLVQSIRPRRPGSDAGKFIDNDDLIVLRHVVLVAMEQRDCAQCAYK